MDGKIKLAGKPRTLLQRFKDFFKSIFKAHSDNGFRSVDDIFDGIKSGKVGKRKKHSKEYLNTKEYQMLRQVNLIKRYLIQK